MITVKNKKSILLLTTVIMVALLASMIFSVSAQAADSYKVTVISEGKVASGVDAVLIEGTTWVSLRSFCNAMGSCTIDWDAKTRTATVNTEGLKLVVTDRGEYIEANGRYLYNGEAAKIFNDWRLYVPVRLLAKAYGLNVSWIGETRTVSLNAGSGMILQGDNYYDSESLYWLSRIIHAESQGEPLLGKIAVGNVVLNRVEDDLYPDSIYNVIFDNRYAVQFSPTASGTIYNTPSDECVIAAKICLKGYSVSEDIVYFFEPTLATSTWIEDNCNYEFSIGCHRFYS